jgi:hypothetical protein
MDNAASGLRRGGDVAGGHPVSETPGLRPQESQRCSKTPPREALDEAGIWTGLLTRLAGGPARGDLAHGSSSVDFPLKWEVGCLIHGGLLP